jgi:hypothetical protein
MLKVDFYRLLTKKPHYDTVLRNKSVTVGEKIAKKSYNGMYNLWKQELFNDEKFFKYN